MKQAPLQILAAIDKMEGLLMTIFPGPVSKMVGGAKQILTGPFLQVFTSTLNEVCTLLPLEAPDDAEVAMIGEEMQKWGTMLPNAKNGPSAAALDELVRCVYLLNGLLWKRLCDEEMKLRLKTMNSLMPLNVVFRRFGDESMCDWPLSSILENLAIRRKAIKEVSVAPSALAGNGKFRRLSWWLRVWRGRE